jgi:hypothetical protein
MRRFDSVPPTHRRQRHRRRKPLVRRPFALLILLASPVCGLDHEVMIEIRLFPRFSSNPRSRRRFASCALAWTLATLPSAVPVARAGDTATNPPAADLVPLKLNLPAPAFVGTPQDIPVGADVDPLSTKPRPPFLVPRDVKNLAPGSKITSSDTNATADALAKITDGDKQAGDDGVVLLRKGTQFVQFDLGAPYELFAIVIWHAHDAPKVYHDVIALVSDDPTFTRGVRTLFNNDKDNSSGQGAGTDREYFETNEGKLIDAKGAQARYVRLYTHGSTESALNEYTEVEIYGRPPK